MAKKTTNKKTNSPNAKKKVDVSNTDLIMEDMKKLALQKIEEKNETKVEDKCTRYAKKLVNDNYYGVIQVEDKCLDDIVKKPEKVENNINTVMKDVDIVTIQSPQSEIENDVNTEQSILKDTNNLEEENLSFVEEINNGEDIVEDETKVEEKPKDIENKPKRKSYSEMFGNTWCGYGYTTD